MTFRSAGAWASSFAALTPALPPGWQVNDLGLMLTSARGDPNPATATATGWTLLQASQNGQLTLLGRILQGGDTDPTVTFSSTTSHHAQIAAFPAISIQTLPRSRHMARPATMVLRRDFCILGLRSQPLNAWC